MKRRLSRLVTSVVALSTLMSFGFTSLAVAVGTDNTASYDDFRVASVSNDSSIVY